MLLISGKDNISDRKLLDYSVLKYILDFFSRFPLLHAESQILKDVSELHLFRISIE